MCGARCAIRTGSNTHLTPFYTSLETCVNEANRILETSGDAMDVTIELKGHSRVMQHTNHPEASGGVYNVCSAEPLPRLTVGIPTARINSFRLIGDMSAEIHGSCILQVMNLCAFEPLIPNRIKQYPKLSMHGVVWTGALWIEIVYPDSYYESNVGEYGLSTYLENDSQIVEAPSVDKVPWFDNHTVDYFYMTRCTIRLPAPTPLNFPKQFYRQQPLFVINGYSTLRHQIWSCSIYSYVGPSNAFPNATPLIIFNNNAPPHTAHPDWLFSNVKFSAEIYGKYLPVCIKGLNMTKVGILHSSISGLVYIQAKAFSVMGCYMLAVGTLDGEPLDPVTNPLTKSIIIRNGPYASSSDQTIQNKAHGAKTPPRIIFDSTAFVCNSAKPIDKTDYADSHSQTTKELFLPWTILNEPTNRPPILAFSVNLYWMKDAPIKGLTDNSQASGGAILSYGVVHLRNSEDIVVRLN